MLVLKPSTMFSELFSILCFGIVNIMCLATIHKRPNIVIIVADDMGRNDVGYNGANQIPTPNIDALAYNGVILNRFYTMPSCTPSRAALLTGLHPIRYGFQGIPIIAGQNRHLPLNTPVLSERLKDLGYKTNLIGKWHLGAAYKKVTPIGRGFDYHFGHLNAYVGYFNHYIETQNMSGLDVHDNLKPSWNTQGEYATTLFTRKSEEVIRNHNTETPLFLVVAHLGVHSTGASMVDLEVPDAKENNKNFNYIVDERRRLYAGMVYEVDKSVGKIVKALKDKKILRNTVIVYISDNGGASQHTDIYPNSASNWPLRGQKLTVLEGGVRCLGIIYSAKLKRKSTVNNNIMHISDLFPTLYSAAGGRTDRLGNTDGINHWPNLLAGTRNAVRNEMLINIDEVRNSSAIIGIKGRFKLIQGATQFGAIDDGYFGEDGRGVGNPPYNISSIQYSEVNMAIQKRPKRLTRRKILALRNQVNLTCQKNDNFQPCTFDKLCLFDLKNDPCETTNVARAYPEIVNTLNKEMETYRKQLVEQIEAPIDYRADPIYCNGSWFTWLDSNGCATSVAKNKHQLTTLPF